MLGPAEPLIIECDASLYGVGARLTNPEKRYSQLDKEALSVLFRVKKFHLYLYGKHFVIRSDHQPLLNEAKAIPPMASVHLQRWALTLSAYEYTFEYKPGKELAHLVACLIPALLPQQSYWVS